MPEFYESTGYIIEAGTKEKWGPGEKAYFEYRCTRGHGSAHAEWWYRSHQPVTVLGLTEPPCEEWYEVEFDDGFKATVFAFELQTDKKFLDPNLGPPPQAEIDHHRSINNNA